MSTLAEATRLALTGQYDSARHALDPLGGARSDDVAVLDLLARVHAQQGDLAAADECWARVESLDPSHSGAREGRRRLRTIWSHRPWPGPRTGAAVAALLLAAGGAATGWSLAPREAPAAAADSTTAEPNVLDRLDQLHTEIAELREQAPQDPAAERLQTLRAALDDPRWTTRTQDGALTVTFRDAVFTAGGAEMSDAGRAALTDLATAAREPEGDLDVAVVGHTSDTAPAPGGPDNAAVGLSRALAAGEVIAAEADLPLGEIAVATSGDVAPPHPNTDEAGRARNQTVTVTLTPR